MTKVTNIYITQRIEVFYVCNSKDHNMNVQNFIDQN